jgi:hypothetical protein
MATAYKIRLFDRNEGVEYRDELVLCRFGVTKTGREWVVYLPGIRDDTVVGELADSDAERVLPRVIKYLKRIYWFGFIPMSYTVRVQRRNIWHDNTT